MTEQVTIGITRGEVEWSFERPPDFKVLRRPVPTLVYPWEVTGAGDWDFPLSRPSTEAEEELYGGAPRLDLMPPGGVFVWLLMRDAQRDNEVGPGSWSPSSPYQYVAPRGGARANGDPLMATQVAPLTDSDRSWCRWANLSSWGRIVLLTHADGTADNEPPYLIVEAFAGPERSSISAVNSLVSSLSYRYVD